MENQLQLVVSSPATSFHDLLASQRELFRSQVDHLENIVVTQCKLTGVNPLSQEMAAGALSIKIGKRPRDLLNPKAVKYMQSVFSIKDVISKKETREISALFGVTATQVRDFFTTQRTRVRKLVRLSREKARKSSASDEPCGGIPLSSHASLPVDPVPLDSVAPTNVEGPSCSTQDEALSGVEESDKDFIDNIFILMRQEEAFSGQVKLMDWILEIQNPSVLQWFLSKGGVMILATWLSQAATEEQTSVLHHILKVLCHLPLHKALPAHMSAILQSVNKLRFYRTSDISNRARILLFRWSKKLANQSSKKPNGLKSASDTQDEMLLKHSIGEVMAEVDGFEESLSQFDTSENLRKLGSTQPLKLLTSSAEESNKKTGRGALSAQTRERRKVQLVEQPGQRMPGRNPQVARTASATQGRPLSADDIQKAKLRAQFLQSKYGKSKTSTDHSPQTKPEGPNKNSVPQDGVFHSTTKTYDLPTINEEKSKINEVKPKIDVEKPAIDEEKPKFDEQKKIADIKSNISNQQETPLNQKRSLDAEEPPPGKKCKAIQIPWRTPPEMVISEKWKICTGGNSKEVEVQKNRIHRERETIYRTLHEIPLNPKEPWDREMDYDDTLTPQIPIEQLPDVDGVETMVSLAENVETIAAPSSSSLPQNVNSSMPEPDLELLAVLLKNPELVFALTSGQAGNLSSEDTVKLLDMIKANGLNGIESNVDKPNAGPKFKDLGGMGSVVEELKMEVMVPLYHPQLLKHLGIRPMSGILFYGPPGCGKTKLAHAIANETGVPFYKISATELVSGISGASEENIRELFSKAYRTAPSIVFIDEIDAIASKRENAQREMERRIVTQLMTCMDESHRNVQHADGNSASERVDGGHGNAMQEGDDGKSSHVLVIGATNRPDSIDPALRRPGRFDREIVLGIPNENARVDILSVLTRNLKVEGAFDLMKIARSTPGFVGADLVALTNKAGNLAMKRIIDQRKTELSEEPVGGEHNEEWWKEPWSPEEMEKVSITMADFEEAVKMVQPSSRREGFSAIPNVKWEDVGGLELLRREFDRYIVRRIKYPEVYEGFGVDLETGFLLYGPPGCGKTLIAKAVANEAGANFIHVKGPELLSKYVGEGEFNIRTLFNRARTCSPCIIFFDEVDALTTERNKEGSYVIERMLNQLLIELDGAEQRKDVYVIGATNRPEAMDRALLRPGRFGKLLYVPLPSPDERGLILKALARKKSIDPSVDLAALGRHDCCKNLSGADLSALMLEAAMAAVDEKLELSSKMSIDGVPTTIKDVHFELARKKITPSVSEEQIEYYKVLSQSFKAA